MNGKLDGAYSNHAACRMQQRGIASELVELLLSIGRSVYHQGRELLMAGAADLLGGEACFEDQDAFRLLALLLDKLLRGGCGSRQAKLDGLTPSVMEQRGLAARSPNSGAVVRGSWRRKSRNQLGHASWLDVVEAAIWCFWHGDSLASGEVLLGVLLGRDERVRLVYGLLAGAFYLSDRTD
ncbi:DUF4258 domain-containing protein [Aeromonas sobria]|uniref:DUF4258 domain-containing protein n=1 Tax=Aeromonas sobria TaxID=646 RepID=UPI00111B502B|nr:DUF4258 domain-containing protein [Aeromonas sobria]